jgi:hypothetical protein
LAAIIYFRINACPKVLLMRYVKNENFNVKITYTSACLPGLLFDQEVVRQYLPPIYQETSSRLYSFTTHNKITFVVITIRTLNPTSNS